MNSRKGGFKALSATASSSPQGKNTGSQFGHSSGGSGSANNTPKMDQQSREMADPSMDSVQDGVWEVYGKKSRNRSSNGASKPHGPSNTPNAWGHQVPRNGGKGTITKSYWQTETVDSSQQAGRGNVKPQSSNRGWESAYLAPPPTIPPPLQNGWQWATRTESANPSQTKTTEEAQTKNDIISKLIPPGAKDSGTEVGQHLNDSSDVDDDDDEPLVESDEDILSDDSGSDVSQKSHKTQKKGRWFKKFFEDLENLTDEQIGEPSRQWHCPACQDGPGAIDWYRGLPPLMTHAKTKGSQRVKLHRKLAMLLEEELRRRGASLMPPGEAFGKWKGLRETTTDHDIVWPPMVVVMNTLLERDENEKWIGMGNEELRDYFHSYEPLRARHSYGPQGHRGMSVLIFEGSPKGYFDAERLHKHFAEQGTDREAWEHRRVPFYPGGRQRQLYGYMACKEDLDIFNRHAQGKSKLKFEMRSFQEVVVGPTKQMSEDNQQLIYFKNEVDRQKMDKKALEETMVVMSKQLHIAKEENRIVKERTKIQHQENKEEMDHMEAFYKEEVAAVYAALDGKEKAFEKLLQEDREKVKLSNKDCGSKEEREHSQAEIARFIDRQTKGIEEFEAEREKVMKSYEDKKTELKRKHLEEELQLDKEFEAELTKLMEKYAPHPPGPSTSTQTAE